MIASLHIGVLGARRFDKKETAVLSAKHGTADGILRISKKLFTSTPEYKEITAAAGQGRAVFNRHTLPWEEETARRIMTSASFIPATQEILECERKFNKAVEPFIERFAFFKAHDRNVLNGLFREEDYPTDKKLRKKFYFRTEYEPIPDAQDFRCDISAEAAETIKKQMEAATKAKLARSMEEPYRRLFDGVAHMASRLQGAKTCECRNCKGKEFSTDQFSDTLVDNLAAICESLPRLNLTGDPALTEMIGTVRAGLTQFTPDAIRDNKTVRGTLAERAAEMQRDLSYFFQAA
jgi:post-segregation antitoxin (ccd killing protein)